MIGSSLGHYEITAKLGEGGMGVVYRAKDLRLHRDVAIKVLSPNVAFSEDHAARFEREAQLLASLNHFNIAQIYGLENEGSTRALVMELVEGPTLAERLAGGFLPFDECLSYAIQIAQALAEAHAKGIVHRDLKPQNIKVTGDGRIKVLDFGLAKQAHGAVEAATLAGDSQARLVLGTIGYMSPEQVRGVAVDCRADIFSFGCVLYEMATGERPFARGTPMETLTATLRDTPEPPSHRRRDLPSGLDRVIVHCLEKQPAERFQSAKDLEFALSTMGAQATAKSVRPQAASVAVLPFLNLSADPENEFFADGITEDVIAHLAKMRSLKVISRTSVMPFKKRNHSLRQIGEKLGAANLLDGSVRRAGNRVRIVAELVNGATEEHVWAETYDRDLTDIFAIQTDVALNIANALRAELSSEERARVDRPLTRNTDAYEQYLRGRHSYYRFDEIGFRRSIQEYESAIERDPGFAAAWANLAEVQAEFCIQGYVSTSPEDMIARAKRAAARALELDPELPEAHGVTAMISFVFDFDWARAEREFRRALDLSPGSAEVHDHYSWLLASQERYDDAVREVRRARELDPMLIQSDVATTLLRAGRIQEALEEAQRRLLDDPGAPRCHSILGWSQIFHGDTEAGIASLQRAVDLMPGTTLFLSQLGQAYALTGEMERGRQILEQLKQRAENEFVSPYHFAYVYAGLGEADAAIDCLERAFERRSGAIYGIKGSFLFRNLRSHPRFQSLLRKMNLA